MNIEIEENTRHCFIFKIHGEDDTLGNLLAFYLNSYFSLDSSYVCDDSSCTFRITTDEGDDRNIHKVTQDALKMIMVHVKAIETDFKKQVGYTEPQPITPTITISDA